MKIDPIPNIKIDKIPSSRQKNRNLKPSKQRGRLYVKIAIPIIVVSWFLLQDFVADTYTVLSYRGDATLVSMADKSGMNMRGKALFLSKSPEIVNANELHSHCPTENSNIIEFGCYIPAKDKIYILEITKLPYLEAGYTTAAHEMLHVAWEELDVNARTEIAVALQEHMGQKNDKATRLIQTSLAEYDQDESVQNNELHAFIGSEVKDTITNDRLDSHFRKYFTNRSLSPEANDKLNQGIEKIETDIAMRRREVDDKEKNLSNYEAKWLLPIEQAMQQNAYYGDYYTYNKNVDAYSNNMEEYQTTYAEYEAFLARLNSDINDYNSAMNAMLPNKQQVDTVPQKSE